MRPRPAPPARSPTGRRSPSCRDPRPRPKSTRSSSTCRPPARTWPSPARGRAVDSRLLLPLGRCSLPRPSDFRLPCVPSQSKTPEHVAHPVTSRFRTTRSVANRLAAPSAPDGGDKRSMVTLGLVGIGGGEGHDRLVECLATAEVPAILAASPVRACARANAQPHSPAYRTIWSGENNATSMRPSCPATDARRNRRP